jgi:hypothetical protein
MGDFVSNITDSIGDIGSSIGGAVSDVGSFVDDAAHVAAPYVAAYYGIPPSVTNAALNMGSSGGGSAPARPATSMASNYNYANNYMPSQGGYGTGGSMMGPQPIIINNTPGQTQQDQSQGGMFSQLLPFLLASGGGLQQQQVNKEAAQTQADALRAAGQVASQSAQFRPVGTTTTFGTSNFKVDPTTGQLTSADYSLSPMLQQYQDLIMGGNRQSLADAEALQKLGRGYVAESPEAAAQKYMENQLALLAPSRDMESARLANQLQQTGRTGVSVAQGGNLNMANPEQQALQNRRMMEDLQLASQAQREGRAQTQFGQGLLTSAYDPFNAGIKTAAGVESLARQPFDISTSLAQQASQAGANAGRLGYTGASEAANAMLRANQVSPFADILTALGKTPTATSAIGGAIGGLFGGNASGGQGGGGGIGLMYEPSSSYDPGFFGSSGGTSVYNPDAFNMNTDYGNGGMDFGGYTDGGFDTGGFDFGNFDFSNYFS